MLSLIVGAPASSVEPPGLCDILGTGKQNEESWGDLKEVGTLRAALVF